MRIVPADPTRIPPVSIAWISYFPLGWLPNLPEELRYLPRLHPATWQRVLLNELKPVKGLRLHVVLAQTGLARSCSFEMDHVVFHCLKVPKGMRSLSLFWWETHLIRRCLRTIQPDMVHAWGTERGAALVASLALQAQSETPVEASTYILVSGTEVFVQDNAGSIIILNKDDLKEKKIELTDDSWVVELSYSEVAAYPHGVQVAPPQRVAFVAELVDAGARPTPPHEEIQAGPSHGKVIRAAILENGQRRPARRLDPAALAGVVELEGELLRDHLFRRDAMLRGLARNVHLEQHGLYDTPLCRLPVQLARKLDAVNRVYQRERAHRMTGLVLLERAYQVPFQGAIVSCAREQSGKLGLLRQRFLDAVLTEYGCARLDRLDDVFGRHSLAHRDQLYFAGLPARAQRRGVDPCTYRAQVVGDSAQGGLRPLEDGQVQYPVHLEQLAHRAQGQ